jgi:DHA1 family bicyclomycin/chloramphenicol resistance-like MFS transporter
MSSHAAPLASPADTVAVAPRKMFWLVVLLGALAALGPFSIDTYLPAFPAIAKTYNTTVGAVEITLAVYFVGLSFGQLFYGPFTDTLGRKPPLYFGLVLYVLASTGCVFAPNIATLTVLRFLQALGGCAAMLISRTVVRDYFPAREAARIFSFLMLVIGISPVIAPLVGGWLVVHMSWRSNFWMVSTMGTIILVCVAVFLKESLPLEKRPPLHLGNTLRLYGSLLLDRTFMVYAISGAFIAAGMFAYLEGSPLVFIELNHVSADHFGYFFGAIAVGLVLASQLNGFLVSRVHPHDIFRVVLMVAAASGVVLFVTAKTGFGGFAGILIPMFVFVSCNGFSFPNATALALAPHGKIAGTAAAMLGFVQFALGGLGGWLVSALDNGTSMPLASVMAVAGVLALVTNLAFAPKDAPHMH